MCYSIKCRRQVLMACAFASPASIVRGRCWWNVLVSNVGGRCWWRMQTSNVGGKCWWQKLVTKACGKCWSQELVASSVVLLNGIFYSLWSSFELSNHFLETFSFYIFPSDAWKYVWKKNHHTWKWEVFEKMFTFIINNYIFTVIICVIITVTTWRSVLHFF